jgi:hypothetical protein
MMSEACSPFVDPSLVSGPRGGLDQADGEQVWRVPDTHIAAVTEP